MSPEAPPDSKGGSGGVGGKGGGGAGGCSYAYNVGGGATVTPSGVALDNGSGGGRRSADGAVGPSAATKLNFGFGSRQKQKDTL